ncbi:hypothetical protein RUMCAL_02978 [Ruminococcus callidus ATCC 27760]|uniref:Uncharacterized protein n=1 Tax=Ruminococcus callidus ATCC 27760 TaxID=411473 RepID=U2KAX8_9FIRM|nr:hypothetical protein RUMCAL_02978 [Ruminococcus callidus ATCC 27760]
MCRIQLYYYSRKTSPCQHLKSLILFIFRKYNVNPGENSIFLLHMQKGRPCRSVPHRVCL